MTSPGWADVWAGRARARGGAPEGAGRLGPGGPRRSLRQVSGLQLRVLAAAGTDAEARGALGSEKGLCR